MWSLSALRCKCCCRKGLLTVKFTGRRRIRRVLSTASCSPAKLARKLRRLTSLNARYCCRGTPNSVRTSARGRPTANLGQFHSARFASPAERCERALTVNPLDRHFRQGHIGITGSVPVPSSTCVYASAHEGLSLSQSGSPRVLRLGSVFGGPPVSIQPCASIRSISGSVNTKGIGP